MYLTSSDWLNRNVNKRIEVAFPIENENIKEELLKILDIQLHDNQKARLIDENLNDVMPERCDNIIRSQKEIYSMLFDNNNIKTEQ